MFLFVFGSGAYSFVLFGVLFCVFRVKSERIANFSPSQHIFTFFSPIYYYSFTINPALNNLIVY